MANIQLTELNGNTSSKLNDVFIGRDLTKSTSERTNFKRFERNNDWKLLKLPWKRGKQILNFRRNQNDLEQFIHPRLHHLVKLLENNVDVFYSIFLYHLQRKGKVSFLFQFLQKFNLFNLCFYYLILFSIFIEFN